MSKLFNTTAAILIAASLALGLLAPSAFAGNIGTSKSLSTVGHQAAMIYGTCSAPKIMVRICIEFGPAAPGKLFGPCLHYESQCQGPAYTGQ
jgi:hypothetical protein